MSSRQPTVLWALPLAVVVLFGARTAPAQSAAASPSDGPSVKVGTTIFADYTDTAEPKTLDSDGNPIHPNAFNIGRAYLNVSGRLSRLVSFRLTPDVTRETGSGSSLSGSLTFRLKYAFGQLDLDRWVGAGSWVRIGAQQTPYVDYTEGIYRYRFQGTIFAEREGFLTSSDFGASAHWSLPRDYGDLHAGVYNGDGYSKSEPNDQKAFQVRGTLRPFPRNGAAKGLRLTAFYDGDHYVRSGPRRRLILGTTFEHRLANAGFEYLNGADQTSVTKAETRSSGWSLWATPKLRQVTESRWGLEALARFDSLQPDESVDARRKRTIVGVAYWFPAAKGVSAAVLVDMDRATYDAPLARPREVRYAVHTLFSF